MFLERSPEQRSYSEALTGWLAAVSPSAAVRRWLDTGNSSEFESRFIGDGWAGVGLAERDGGQGGGLTELALTAEALAAAAVPSAVWLANVLSAPALAGRPDLLAAALAGETTALLMPADRYPGPVPLTIDADGKITGSVPLVMAADRSARFTVLTCQGTMARFRLIEAEAPGVTVIRRRLLDRTRSAADVTLDQVASEPLPADTGTALLRIQTMAGVLIAADSLGAANRMLDLAVSYSKQRHQFGVPIGSFQAVKHAAAMMLVGVEAARSIIYYAAAAADQGDPEDSTPPLLAAAAARTQASAEAAAVADSSLTVHGAIGYTWEHDLQLYYKRAKLNEYLYGSRTVWNDLIAGFLA